MDFLTGIKMDGTPDTDYFQIKDAEGNLYYYSETDTWDVTVQGLPEYDENGRAVEYVLAENHNEDSAWSVVMQHTERDEDGNYITTIYNGPPGGRATPSSCARQDRRRRRHPPRGSHHRRVPEGD